MSHILDRRLKEVSEDAERERALKEVTSATEKEKVKAAEFAKKKRLSCPRRPKCWQRRGPRS